MKYLVRNVSVASLEFGGRTVLPDEDYVVFDTDSATAQPVDEMANDSANLNDYFSDALIAYYHDAELKTPTNFWDDLNVFLGMQHRNARGSELYSMSTALGAWTPASKRVSFQSGWKVPSVALSNIIYDNARNVSVSVVTRSSFDISFEVRAIGSERICSVSFDWEISYP